MKLEIIKDFYNNKVLFIEASKTIDDTLKTMIHSGISTAIIVDKKDDRVIEKNILGIVDIKDILKPFAYNINFNDKIKEIADTKFKTVDINDDISIVENEMKYNEVYDFLVSREGNIIGIVTPLDILRTRSIAKKECDYKLEIILENIQEAICVIDKDYVVTFWNKAAENLYKVKKEEIYGKSIKHKFPNALLVQTLKNKKSYENIKHRPNKDSYVILSTKPIIVNGQVIGAVSTDKDISKIEKLSSDLHKEREMVEELQNQVLELTTDRYHFDKIIGKSKALTDCIKLSKKVARTDASVMITGESGTGKEVFARAIHKESGRSGNFIPINCSAIPANLLESELFGYEEGAFTGASKKGKPGKFELANGGTLFLDEIGDMPFIMQAKLLRVLQDGVVTRVGGEKSIKIDARIIAATNKDLKDMMKKEEFREDLYYRLNVVSIEIPPLRDRREDIPDLIESFIGEFAIKNNMGNIGITPEAMQLLTDYTWNGNIRQLRNTVERLVILSQNHMIDILDIPKEIVTTVNTTSFLDLQNIEEFDLKEAVENFEKEVIINALIAERGNKARAAERLKIKRSTLYYKLNLYEIDDYDVTNH